MKKLRIGTRGSPLALTQTNMVRSALSDAHPYLETEIVIINTSGDWKPEQGETRLCAQAGGKGLFAKEIEEALLAGKIDIAVHSMKDMAAFLPDGLQIAHMLPREDPRDALLLNSTLAMSAQTIESFPKGTVIGTSSVRRQAFLLAQNPGLSIVPLRGNVQTRIDKLKSGQVQATLLAYAGLKRLGLANEASAVLDTETMLPAAGQGAIGIEMREADTDIAEILDAINCFDTLLCVSAERAALGMLDGSCHTPIGAHATLKGNSMLLRIRVASLDGSQVFETSKTLTISDAQQAKDFGRALAAELKTEIPQGLLAQKIDEKQERKPRYILVTRPEDSGADFSKTLQEMGYETLIAPALSVEHLPFAVPSLAKFGGLVFTSANAVHAFCKRSADRNIPVYAVGDSTAKIATQYGFSRVHSAQGDAGSLVNFIAGEAQISPRPLLHVRGRDVARPLDALLAERSIGIENLVVYQTNMVETLPDGIISALRHGQVEAVTFFSRRSAEAFMRLIEVNGLEPQIASIKALCIGPAVLEYVQGWTWLETHASRSPHQGGMVILVERVCAAAATKNDIQKKDTGIMSNNQRYSLNSDQPLNAASEIIERFGGIRPMAKKMGVAVTTVQGWKKRDAIPANRVADVIASAASHSINLSDLIAETPGDASTAKIANENSQRAEAYTPAAEPARPSFGQQNQTGTFEAPSRAERERDLESKLSKTEKNAIRKSTWINFILLSGGLLGLAFVLFGGEQQDLTQKLSSLEENVGDIREDVDAVKDQQNFLTTLVPENLDERINKIQEQALEAQQKVNAAIATAETISADVMADDGSTPFERAQRLNDGVRDATGFDMASYLGLDALLDKFNALGSTMEGQAQLDSTMAELGAVLSSAKLNPLGTSVEDQLIMARETMPSLSSTFENVPPEDLKAAALLLGMSQFRKSLNRDRAAFNDDLAVLQMLVGDSNPALSDAINKLAPYSEQGILTTDGLTNEFKTIAGEAVIASIKGEDVSLEDKIKGRIGEVLQVEKDGDLLIGNETQLTVNKAEKHLAQGDIATAVNLLEQLGGPAAGAFAPWIREAKATLEAQSLNDTLSQAMSGEALTTMGFGSGHMIRDKSGSTNVYVPAAPVQNTIENAVDGLMNGSGL